MTRIVFECNSFREELKVMTEKLDILEKEAVEARNEKSHLQSRLEEALDEGRQVKESLECAKREIGSVKDENDTLKAELTSLKEELGGEETKALIESKQLEKAIKEQKESTEIIEVEISHFVTTDWDSFLFILHSPYIRLSTVCKDILWKL